jgi:hypothetical protein
MRGNEGVRARAHLGRFLAAPALVLVVVAGFAVAPAGASPVGGSVSGTGICLGYPDAGGCGLGLGGTMTGVAGSTVLFGATFVATSGSDEDIILEGSGSGIVFPDDTNDYQVDNETTMTGCSVSDVNVYNSGQSAFVDMPAACAAAPGAKVVVLVQNTVLPGTVGSFTITMQTGEDFNAVETNAIQLISAPSAPKNLSVGRGNQSITVSWEAPDDLGGSSITGYDVYCSTRAPDTSSTPVASTDALTMSATLSGLSAHTTYNCLVTALNAAGPSGPSDLVSAAPFEVPGVPTGISTTVGNHRVTIFWSPPTDIGGTRITGYHAYCSATFPPTVDAGDLCGAFGPSKRSGTILGLINQHTVYVAVTAINQAGESALSGIGGPTPTGPPSPPTGVQITPRRGLFDIRWRIPNSGGQPITSYTAVCDVGLPVPGVSPSQSTTTNHIVFSGLTSGTQYYCVVVAHNQNGASGPSGVVTSTPL